MSKTPALTEEELARIGGKPRNEPNQAEIDAEAARILREATQARKDAKK